MNTLERALLELKTSFLSENQNEALASNSGGRKEGRGSVSVQQPPHSSRFGSSCTPILCQASRCDSSDIENPIDFYDFRKMLVSFTE